jgi:hypothetical protein
LDVAVAEEAERSVLGERCSLVVDRTIVEVKGYPAGDHVAIHSLAVISDGNADAGLVPDFEKSMRGALRVKYRNGVPMQGSIECKQQK